ncbi:helix-turn-helix domain-containing protein [Priestia koreensis]|uniref:helix-turn-helix domain-containing protein n=2 Tax=Priestia koreensis TaxID=284581 RepID=UPI00301B3621
MKEYNIGEKIKELRLSLEISQNDLAKQICEPQDLEKIEKGDEYPTLPQLHTLAKRLGIPITYFFETNWNQNVDYVNSVKTLMRNYARDREYKALYEIVKREEQSDLFRDKLNKQFLMWHEGICVYHVDKNKGRSLEMLYDALKITNREMNDFTEDEIQIMHSIGVIYFLSDDVEKALNIYREALNALEEMYNVADTKVYLRVVYGLSLALLRLQKYDECLKYSNLGLGMCISEDILYLFAEFHYQIGHCLVKLGDPSEGLEYLNKASTLFNTQVNLKMEEIVKEETIKLLNESLGNL